MGKDFAALKKYLKIKAPAANKTKLFYYVNKLTDVHCLYISPFIASNILAIAHGEDHSGFA